jgi:membrane-associated HD superfamily phosphohydrolase
MLVSPSAGYRLYKETKSMSEYQEPIQVTSTATPRWVGIALVVLAAVSLVGIGIGWSALNHANTVEQATQASVKQANDALAQKLAKEDEINQQLQSDLKVVTDKLNVTQSDLVKARKQNHQSSVTFDKKIAGLESSVNTQLAAKANSDDVNRLNTDVTGVKSDLDATKNNLQMARSEMGTLIARNHDEIDQLRRMGTRDYYEFTVTRKAGAQKVGAVQVELKNANPKKNQFTINVLADDKSFEKKNRSVNEPIFFYTGGSHAALELVINKVTKSTASGYLSVPKSAGSTAASSSTSGS